MRAMEGGTHRRAQVVGYPVAGEPAAGAALPSSKLVGRVRLRPDHHDPLGGKGVEQPTAALGKVGGADDDEVGPVSPGTCHQVRWLGQCAGSPAAMLAIKKFDDQPLQTWMSHCDENRRPPAAHGTRARIAFHGSMLLDRRPFRIRLEYAFRMWIPTRSRPPREAPTHARHGPVPRACGG